MFSFKVSMRFLKNKVLQFIMIVFIIAIGTSVFYFVLNATKELNNFVIDTTLRDFSDIMYTGYIDETKEEVNSFRDELFSLDKDIVDVSFYKLTEVVKQEAVFYLKGVDFNQSSNIHGLGELVYFYPENEQPKNGEFEDYDIEILIPPIFARTLIPLGKTSAYHRTIGMTTTIEVNNEIIKAKVVGAFISGNLNVNTNLIFTTEESVEKITKLTGYNGIDINVKDSFKSIKTFEQIDEVITERYPNVNGMPWQTPNKMINDLFTLEKTSVFIIQFFTAIAVSFSLATIIFLNTKTRLSQIGILKAQGLSPTKTSMIFIYHFIFYSVIGISLGILLGNLYGAIFKKIVVSSEGKEILNISTTFFNPASLISMGVITFGLIIANIYPLLLTRKLKVVDIIKAE